MAGFTQQYVELSYHACAHVWFLWGCVDIIRVSFSLQNTATQMTITQHSSVEFVWTAPPDLNETVILM